MPEISEGLERRYRTAELGEKGVGERGGVGKRRGILRRRRGRRMKNRTASCECKTSFSKRMCGSIKKERSCREEVR